MTDEPKRTDENYREMLMALSPGQRIAMACRMFSTAKALAEAGIRQRQATTEDSAHLHRKIFLHLYRHDFTPGEANRILCRLKDADHLRSIAARELVR